MYTVRIATLIGIASLLSGCGSFGGGPLAWNQSYRPDISNLWLADADAANQSQIAMAPTARPHASPNANLAARYSTGPQMPLRADVAAQRQAEQSAQTQPADTEANPSIANMRAAMQACNETRSAFGGAEERRIAFLIQMDIEQARAVAESASIDTATKAQLLSELSRDVKSLTQRSQGLELFRDGAYALCQAHASGALTKAAYSERFDSLLRAASDNVRSESTNLRYASPADDTLKPVSMPHR